MLRSTQQVPSAFGNREFLPAEERLPRHLLGFYEQVHLAASLDILIHISFSLEVVDTTIFPPEKRQMHACKTL